MSIVLRDVLFFEQIWLEQHDCGSKYIGDDEDANHSKSQHQLHPDAEDKSEPGGDSHKPSLPHISSGNELAGHRADERAKEDTDKPKENTYNGPKKGTDYRFAARPDTFCTNAAGYEIGDKGDKRQYAKEDHRPYADKLETIPPCSKQQANIDQWRSR